MPETFQVYTNPNSSVLQQTPAKKSKWKYLLTATISLILIIALGSGYLFWWVPQAQAKEFVAKAGATFGEINQKVDPIYQNFAKIKTQLPAAQSSFAEITKTTTDYDYIKKDTEGDIEDINSVLALVKEARKQLNDLEKPDEVQSLAISLDGYYSTLEETLVDLLEHQQLSQAMIIAHGKELYDALVAFQKLYSSGGARADFISDCQKIASLSSDAQTRMKAITKVNPNEQDYYDAEEEFLVDVETTFGQTAVLYQNGKDKEADDLFQAFSKRTQERNKRVQDNADKYVSDSIAARGFLKLPSLKTEVNKEIAALVEKYGLEIPGFKKEATPSAEPNKLPTEASPSTVLNK